MTFICNLKVKTERLSFSFSSCYTDWFDWSATTLNPHLLLLLGFTATGHFFSMSDSNISAGSWSLYIQPSVADLILILLFFSFLFTHLCVTVQVCVDRVSCGDHSGPGCVVVWPPCQESSGRMWCRGENRGTPWWCQWFLCDCWRCLFVLESTT